MKAQSLSQAGAYLGGRRDREAEGFTMYWPGDYIRLNAKCGRLDIEIEAETGERRDYISFIIDGLKAQTFAPIEGKHWYTVFLGMNPEKLHEVAIVKETMAFPDKCFIKVSKVRSDGSFEPVIPRKRKIEFIGDSITCGEGCRGPVEFDEWLPMMFGASDAFPKVTSDLINAEYQCVSISGWGVLNGWDNNPNSRIPSIYDKLCAQKTDADYDFAFNPDTVVIALGTNDNNALIQPPYTDPKDGATNKFTDSKDDLGRLTQAAADFLRHLSAKNEGARLVWASFYTSGAIHDALESAVEEVKKEGIDAYFTVPVDLNKLPRGGMGSRYHPGPVTHVKIARELYKLLKKA